MWFGILGPRILYGEGALSQIAYHHRPLTGLNGKERSRKPGPALMTPCWIMAIPSEAIKYPRERFFV